MPKLNLEVVSDDESTTHYSGEIDLTDVPDEVVFDTIIAHFSETHSATISGN